MKRRVRNTKLALAEQHGKLVLIHVHKFISKTQTIISYFFDKTLATNDQIDRRFMFLKRF